MSFLSLPGSLPFECDALSDLEDFLVPQANNDFSLSSESTADLFLGAAMSLDSSEATSSFSPASPASSRLQQQLSSSFSFALDDLDQPQPQVSTAAALPLGRDGLKLKLDFGAVLSAWHMTSGGAHPFQLRGEALTSVAAMIPSTAHLELSVAAASQPGATDVSPAGSRAAAAPAGVGASATSTGAQAPRKEVARPPPKKPSRKHDRRPLYTMRKLSNDKRPRIKGRFVTKAEFEQMVTAQVVEDRAVPVGSH